MDFQPVKASDKEIIDKYMKKANSQEAAICLLPQYICGKTFIY